MKEKMTEKNFQMITKSRSMGEISFPEFLNELAQKGITEYNIDVASGTAIYKGKDLEFKTEAQVSVAVSKTFNAKKIQDAILNINLGFKDFLKEIGEAGVATYRVEIEERKVIYNGVNGEQMEEQIKQ